MHDTVDPASRVTVVSGAGLSEHAFGDDSEIVAVEAIDASGTAYLRHNSYSLSAVDIATWSTKWTVDDTYLGFVTAIDGGSVLLFDYDNTELVTLSSAGSTLSRTAAPQAADAYPINASQGLLHGIDWLTGSIGEYTAPDICEASFIFIAGQGNLQRKGRGKSCILPPHLSYTRAMAPRTNDYKYKFMANGSTDEAWTADPKAGVADAFALWNAANAAAGISVHFSEETGSGPADIELHRKPLASDQAGLFTPSLSVPHGSTEYISAGGIDLQSDAAILKSRKGYLKVALHEIGHVMGLDHTPTSSANGTSVMNRWGAIQYSPSRINRRDDPAGLLPTKVTPCDSAAVAELY